MNRTSLGRKLIYLVVLVAMLIPLYLLGQPAGGGGDGGGELASLRSQYNMAEANLGEISPASETMKLASLGLRGVAATLLWNRAHDYKVMHEWDRLKATLNNIALLQPHFDKVWEHQAHNLAYNVSTEFDDYRQRYEMVREGTEFLTRGLRQNRNAPRLVWYTGWFYGSKMGTADEKRQFRRLFADDEILHDSLREEDIAVDSSEARGPLNKPDNWLVGRLWLNFGYDLVDSGVSIKRQTPINFYETGPKWRMRHAEAIESEGILDSRAAAAWQRATDDWEAFGDRSIPTTAAFTIQLDRLEDLKRQRAEKVQQFADLTGDEFVKGREQKIAELRPDDRAIFDIEPRDWTDEQRNRAQYLEQYLDPDFAAVAKVSPPDVRLKAVQLQGEIEDLDERIIKTRNYREQINYAYWKTLAQAEQEERTIRARRLIYDAEAANRDAELDKAIELYEEAFKVWAEVFEDYPILVIDDAAQDLFDSIRRYMVAIDSDELPVDFPLYTFTRMMGEYGQVDPNMYRELASKAGAAAKQRLAELEAEERAREEAARAEDAEAKANEDGAIMLQPETTTPASPVDTKDAAGSADATEATESGESGESAESADATGSRP